MNHMGYFYHAFLSILGLENHICHQLVLYVTSKLIFCSNQEKWHTGLERNNRIFRNRRIEIFGWAFHCHWIFFTAHFPNTFWENQSGGRPGSANGLMALLTDTLEQPLYKNMTMMFKLIYNELTKKE